MGWAALRLGTGEPVPVGALLSITCEKSESLACVPAEGYMAEKEKLAALLLAPSCLTLGRAVPYSSSCCLSSGRKR